MKKLTILLAIALIASINLFGQTEPTDTDGDDYLNVSTLDHLRWISENSSAWSLNFELDNDIDASDTENWNGGEGWSPIGNNTNKFSGVFNGKGFIIYGLNVNRENQSSIGLFGYLNQATISHVGVENCVMKGKHDVGLLVGVSDNRSKIKYCFSNGEIFSTGNNIGGLVGHNVNSTIRDSYSHCKVVGVNYVGGLAGVNSITGNSTITNSYSTGEVDSDGFPIGGLVGYNWNMVENSYWDSETSKIIDSNSGEPKTTSEMKIQSTFVEWDFENIWEMPNNDYPRIRKNIIELPNNPQDSLALVALYNATDGDNWTNNDGWLTDKPIDEWHGITVVNNRVKDINLYENNLSGIIPSELGNLTNLVTLYLWGNQLSGTIPSELGNLENLESLWLGSNQLSGNIPSELGNLTELNYLSLTRNKFNGSIPKEISNLKNLETLALGGNQFSGIIPSELVELLNLKELYLWGNQLTGSIPAELGKLVNLENLQLSTNQLSGSIPSELGSLTKLKKIEFGRNELTGNLPNEIFDLSQLTYFGITRNKITGIMPNDFNKLKNLELLALGGNQFSGIIPSELGELTSLNELYLWGNELTGTIPSELGKLESLEVLSIKDNKLEGKIPNSFENLKSLKDLSVSGNSLTGAIPKYFAELNSLETFWAHNNKFESCPDFSGIATIDTIKVQGNRLDFGDIEPNASIPGFVYTPQDSIGIADTLKIDYDTQGMIELSVSGNFNTYKWYKDGNEISGKTDKDFIIEAMTEDDEGIYTCEINNSVATELTLYTRPMVVVMNDPSSVDDYLGITTGIESAYPNPAKDYINMNYNIATPAEYELGIYDISGNKVQHLDKKHLSYGTYTRLIDVSDLPAGTYRIRIQSSEKTIQEKFVIAR